VYCGYVVCDSCVVECLSLLLNSPSHSSTYLSFPRVSLSSSLLYSLPLCFPFFATSPSSSLPLHILTMTNRTLHLPQMLRLRWTWSKVLYYLIFHSIHLALFIIGWSTQATNPTLAPLNTLTFSVWISRGAALALTLDTTLLLLPMCRHLMTWARPKVRWLPLDETLHFHRDVAMSLVFWTGAHVGGHYVK